MPAHTDATFSHRLLLVSGLVILLTLLFALRVVIVLALAAAILATALYLIGGLYRRLKLGHRLSTVLAGATVIGLVVLVGWVAGHEIRTEFETLAGVLPQAQQVLTSALERLGLPAPREFIDTDALMQRFAAPAFGRVSSIAMQTLQVGFQLLVVLFGALFLAIEPGLYHRGLMAILPGGARDDVDRTIKRIARGLRVWLIARLVAMTLVGSLYWLAMTLIGVPGALAIGFVSGFLEFIPYLGPILGGALAVAVALTLGVEEALFALVAAIVIQQLEGNVITPLIEQKAVRLPPALNVFTVISMATLFGPVGVFVASPTLLIGLIATQELWLPHVRRTSRASTPEQPPVQVQQPEQSRPGHNRGP